MPFPGYPNAILFPGRCRKIFKGVFMSEKYVVTWDIFPYARTQIIQRYFLAYPMEGQYRGQPWQTYFLARYLPADWVFVM